MKIDNISLADLGWRPVLQQQLTLEDLTEGYPARVDAVFRDRVHVMTELGERIILASGILKTEDSSAGVTTGDWLWLEHETDRPLKILERLNVLSRTAAGTDPKTQLIAANIDTLFIVSSCNQDFNLSRLERYLSLVLAANIPAVLVLTKADLVEDPESYVMQAQKLHRDVPVITLNALEDSAATVFSQWIGNGQTLAFIGSSGVGKSTLTNSILGYQLQLTGGIREGDAKGRHTTTGRAMFRSSSGAWLLDTPGMRELRLNDDDEGVSALFEDIEALMLDCKFSNCHHEGDKGCAIEIAINSGQIDHRRWESYKKLKKETENASKTKAERAKARQQWGKDIAKFARSHKKNSSK